MERDAGEDVYVQSLVIEDEETKLQEVHICAGGPDVGRLEEAVRAAFEATIERHRGRPEFGGEIHVAILSEVTPQTPELWQTMSELEARLGAALKAAHLRTMSGHPVRISFEFTGGDLEASNGEA